MNNLIPLLTTTINICWERLPKTVATIKKLKVGTYKFKDVTFRLERKKGENLIYLLEDTDYAMAGLICKHTLELPALNPEALPLLPTVCQMYVELSKGEIKDIKLLK